MLPSFHQGPVRYFVLRVSPLFFDGVFGTILASTTDYLTFLAVLPPFPLSPINQGYEVLRCYPLGINEREAVELFCAEFGVSERQVGGFPAQNDPHN